MLINRKKVKEFALEMAKHRAHKLTRVGSGFFVKCGAIGCEAFLPAARINNNNQWGWGLGRLSKTRPGSIFIHQPPTLRKEKWLITSRTSG